MRRKGFTVMELVVVVLMFGVLLATLQPLLSETKEEAEQAKCMANLKQLGLAALMYANDYGGYVFRTHDGVKTWAQQLAHEGKYIPETSLRDKNGVLRCPTGGDVSPQGKVWNGYEGGSYSMNDQLGDEHFKLPQRKLSTIKKPVILFFDGPYYHQIGGNNPEGDYWFKHNNGYNAVFTDGHVEWAAKGTWGWSGNYKPQYWVPQEITE